LIEQWRHQLYEEQQHLARDRVIKKRAILEANDVLINERAKEKETF